MTPVLWVVGAHGGSGESALAALDRRWHPAGHVWPAHQAPCVLVARTHLRGVLAAQAALTQWAAAAAGGAQLLGLVLVADAPGRQPAPLRDFAAVVGGGAPRVWEIPWIEEWRFLDPAAPASSPASPAAASLPRRLRKLVSELRSLAPVKAGELG